MEAFCVVAQMTRRRFERAEEATGVAFLSNSKCSELLYLASFRYFSPLSVVGDPDSRIHVYTDVGAEGAYILPQLSRLFIERTKYNYEQVFRKAA